MNRKYANIACAIAVFSNFYVPTPARAEFSANTASNETEACAMVAERASNVMTGRQAGLSFDGAMLHLGHTDTDRTMIVEAYNLPRSRNAVASLAATETFASDWMHRCLEGPPQ